MKVFGIETLSLFFVLSSTEHWLLQLRDTTLRTKRLCRAQFVNLTTISKNCGGSQTAKQLNNIFRRQAERAESGGTSQAEILQAASAAADISIGVCTRSCANCACSTLHLIMMVHIDEAS